MNHKERSAQRFPLEGGTLLLDPSSLGRLWFADDEGDDEDGNGYARVGSVAIVSVDGPLLQRGGLFWDGYEAVATRFVAALVDPAVGAILLKVNSPGGVAAGAFESVRAMREAKAQADKPVVAVADEVAYSGAYALASVADQIVVPETGGVGSVGVIRAVYDFSQMNDQCGLRVAVLVSGPRKADGHPDVALTPEARDRMQSDVDTLAGVFIREVAGARGLTPEAVRGLDAGTFLGAAAVKAGLADRVGGVREALMLAAAQARPTGKETMTMKTVLKALSLDEDATETAALAAVTTLLQRQRQFCAAAGTHDPEEALGAVHAFKGDAAKARELGERIARLEAETAEAERTRAAAERTRLLDESRADGRITPHERAQFDADPELVALPMGALKRMVAMRDKQLPLRERHEAPPPSPGPLVAPAIAALVTRAETQGFAALTPDEKARLFREARPVHDALKAGQPVR